MYRQLVEMCGKAIAYSQLGIVMSPPSEYLWYTPNCWSPQCL